MSNNTSNAMPSRDKTPIAAAIPNDLHERILSECAATGKSKNALIADILHQHYFKPNDGFSGQDQPDTEALDRLIDYAVNNSFLTRKQLKKVVDGK